MFSHRVMWILWPSFLLAGVLEMVVFSVVDPHDLHWPALLQDLSRQAVYTLGFFAFWIATAASSALTVLLGMKSSEVNQLD